MLQVNHNCRQQRKIGFLAERSGMLKSTTKSYPFWSFSLTHKSGLVALFMALGMLASGLCPGSEQADTVAQVSPTDRHWQLNDAWGEPFYDGTRLSLSGADPR